MKTLGIDFGSKRIGIALSDEDNTIAFPKSVIKNDSDAIKNVLEIIKSENIKEVVVGESLNQKGEKNKIFFMIEDFIAKILENFDIQIYKEKEFFTSFEAHFRQGKERFNDRKTKINKTEELDAKSAAIILQRYLDRKNINN
jgi:putative Holliday junction resolvase